MMSPMKSISTFNATLAPRNLGAYAAAVVAKLRDPAPYVVIALVAPGGSVMALLLWLYRRQKKSTRVSRNSVRGYHRRIIAAASACRNSVFSS